MSESIVDVVNKRKIILGPRDKVKSMHTVKYPWAADLFRQMQHNEWLSSSVKTLAKDNLSELNPGTQLAYKRALAFLTGLDGLQVENLTNNIVEHVTDPNIQMCIYRQIYEEANHVEAYDKIISTVIDDPAEIYMMHENDSVLHEKNEFVLAQANAMKGEFNVEKFIYAVISNIILEGVYFHTGFLLFYTISRLQRKMIGSSDMVKYIQRDETTHCVLFQNIFNSLLKEFPEAFNARVYDNIFKLFEKGNNLEVSWGKHLIEEGVPGISEDSNETYVKSLTDKRSAKIGLEKMYNANNPYPWVEEFSKPNNTDGNSFETTIKKYSKKSLDSSSMF